MAMDEMEHVPSYMSIFNIASYKQRYSKAERLSQGTCVQCRASEMVQP